MICTEAFEGLQWGRRLRTADMCLPNAPDIAVIGASMGPPSEDGGYAPTDGQVLKATSCFNGAAV